MGARREQLVTPQSDADGISLSQTPAAGGVQSFTLNGAFVTSGAVGFTNASHIIEFVQAADETGRTYTITGTDPRDVAITEAVSGSTGTVSSTKYFKTITGITIDANSAGALTIGTSGLACSSWVLFNHGESINIGLAAVLSTSASLTYAVEHTFDDLQSNTDLTITTIDHDDLTGKTATDDGNYAFSAFGFRVKTTAFTSGTVTLTSIQAY